jgi:hypothetical protein
VNVTSAAQKSFVTLGMEEHVALYAHSIAPMTVDR